MKKVLSVIFILLTILGMTACSNGKPAHMTEDSAISELEKMGMNDPIIENSAMCGFADKAIAFYEAYEGEANTVIALEFDVHGENDYKFVSTHIPDKYADGIYTLCWEDKSIVFVTNEDCAVMTADEGENGIRVDEIRKSSHPYITVEEGEAEFHFYREDMTEIK